MSIDDSPMDALFQMYILDVIGALPPDRLTAVEKLNLQGVLQTKASDWRGALREILHLSETFEIAVWDIWLGNREKLGPKATASYTPQAYARDFVREFLREGSQIDVWPGNSLAEARNRVGPHLKR